jgi:hypothetical protein
VAIAAAITASMPSTTETSRKTRSPDAMGNTPPPMTPWTERPQKMHVALQRRLELVGLERREAAVPAPSTD